MREILFRGKRIDDGKWITGYIYEHDPPLQAIVPDGYVPEESKWYIARTAFADWNMPRQVEFIRVDPSTIGQYTGLTDKNGKKIFEGDIVHLSCKEGEWDAIVAFGNPNCFYSWGWQLRPIKDTHFNEDILLWVETEDANVSCEVISNVYYGAQEAAQAVEGGK